MKKSDRDLVKVVMHSLFIYLFFFPMNSNAWWRDDVSLTEVSLKENSVRCRIILLYSRLLMCFVSFILIWTHGDTASGGKRFQDSSCRVSCPNQPEFRSRKERTITENVYAPFCYGVPLTEPVAPGWIGPDGYKELRRSKKFWISPPFNLLCLKFYQQGCITLPMRWSTVFCGCANIFILHCSTHAFNSCQ